MDLWVKSATLLPINILRIKNLTIIIYEVKMTNEYLGDKDKIKYHNIVGTIDGLTKYLRVSINNQQ